MVINKRITSQKLKILEFLKSVKTHPSAEAVFQNVRNDLPTISLATVYRNLNQMADDGEILRLEINKEYRYDADTCSHQHCVCKECNSITDTYHKNISQYALKNIKEDFNADCVNIIFIGLCNNCGGAKNVQT